MTSQDQADTTTEDALLGGRLRLHQPRDGHRAGTDAVLLAAAATARGTVIDLGAGVGTVGLILAQRGAARVLLVERDAHLAALAAANAMANGLGDRVTVVVADVTAPAPVRRALGLADRMAEAVVMNPPFHDAATGRASPDPARAAARHADPGVLDAWIRTARALLAPGGTLTLIHRADALAAVLRAMGHDGRGATLRFVHTQGERPATRLLLAWRAGSRAPLAVLPPVVLHGASGQPTAESLALHRGGLLTMTRP